MSSDHRVSGICFLVLLSVIIKPSLGAAMLPGFKVEPSLQGSQTGSVSAQQQQLRLLRSLGALLQVYYPQYSDGSELGDEEGPVRDSGISLNNNVNYESPRSRTNYLRFGK
ncbi:hypothetical protein RvY_08141 [Ramazzottius varieornatus]|uniref:Uncharacterized protein n=1 Tax=Ramazzottius varieornatus TaxID=947166 RepID=A0A1D1V9K3_RAMVA|nr:hypothetical protein RvY_08141 [Ramazzottius varieornatus]